MLRLEDVASEGHIVFRCTVFGAACLVVILSTLTACGGAGSSSSFTPPDPSKPNSSICDGVSRSGHVPDGSCETPAPTARRAGSATPTPAPTSTARPTPTSAATSTPLPTPTSTPTPAPTPTNAPTPSFKTLTEKDGLGAGAEPQAIAAGPSSTVWFTDVGTPSAIGYVSATSVIYEIPLTNVIPLSVVYDRQDGHIWFTETDQKIGKIDPYNPQAPVMYDIAQNLASELQGRSIVADAAGRLWIALGTRWYDANHNDAVALFDPVTHTSVTYKLNAYDPVAEAFDSDGNLWIAERDSAQVEVMSTGAMAGTIRQTIPLPNSSPRAIALGPDGNMWVADGLGAIWRITPSGTTEKFSLPGCEANSIASDSTRSVLWFTTYNCNHLNSITTSGFLASWSSPGVAATGVTMDANHDLWYSADWHSANWWPSIVHVTL
jgi:streptogramin lyase